MSVQGVPELQRRLKAVGDTRGLLKLLQLQAVAEAKALVPRKTTHLAKSIVPGFLADDEAFVVASANYARYVEEGTGLYGPRKKKIVPKTKKVLAWRTGAGGAGGSQLRLSGRSRVVGGKELGGWAFARSVKGRKPTPYLLPGARTAIRKSGVNMKARIVKEWNDAA